jgi:hypothetical protein
MTATSVGAGSCDIVVTSYRHCTMANTVPWFRMPAWQA